MGHASIATTNLYLHHLGTAADQAGLARLNAQGHATEVGIEMTGVSLAWQTAFGLVRAGFTGWS